MGNNVIVSAEQLSKAFGVVRALEGVSITFRQGEVLALAGENGQGSQHCCGFLKAYTHRTKGRSVFSGTCKIFASLRMLTQQGYGSSTRSLTSCPT